MAARPRVLLAITVYNGESFIRRTLESALRIDTTDADIDVVVLDDASPAPGFSGRLAAMCAELGIGYYRTPRNLGIPRNVSLGLLAAVEKGYDYSLISNSDVVYPRNLVSQQLRAVRQPGVGSVTAWSNNVSMYSLPNSDPDRYLSDQDRVDWMSETLAEQFGDAAMDIPAGISFCILVPAGVIRQVGVMDPVFGRGYCEETDWSLRSLGAGLRIALAPGTFVYHAGRGSNLEAGLVTGDLTSVPDNEAIIDLRYPLFRAQVGAFSSSGILQDAHKHGTAALIAAAAAKFGYTIDVGWLPPSPSEDDVVRCTLLPDGLDGSAVLEWAGFRQVLDLDAFGVGEVLRERFGGRAPTRVNIRDAGPLADALGQEFSGLARRSGNYPARV